jgi:hypothetical protein
MKTVILIIVALATTAALPIPIVNQNASDQLARQIIAAFKKSSPMEYAALFPKLAEFQTLMEKNSSVYGEYLSSAKEEFAVRYKNEIIPSLKESFTTIIQDGNTKGIDWSAIKLERVDYSTSARGLKPILFTIVFSAKGKDYRMTIDKAFIIHDA